MVAAISPTGKDQDVPATKKKSAFKMVSDSTKCVGCLLCQMRCSFRFTGTFGPAQARIDIDWSDADCGYGISFTPDCDNCALCAKYCVYGALAAERVGR
jgi:Fe-S-cluster-containing dehydrogenase component